MAQITTVYFVRHAEPNYQNKNTELRELTEKGKRDTALVTDFFADKEIAAVLSSPYVRAMETVRPFAEKYGFDIRIDIDFREREMANTWVEIPDYEAYFLRCWNDFDFKLPTGESLQDAQMRNLAALNRVLDTYAGKNVIIGSHGTALGTIMHYFDPDFGYEGHVRLTPLMPHVVGFQFEGNSFLSMQEYRLIK